MNIDATIKSPNYSHPKVRRTPRLIVIHTTESHERVGTARAVATNWFALKSSKVSAHYIVDPAEVVQCVDDAHVAWHAGAVNGYSLGVELCGKAGQTAGQWADEDSGHTLFRSAVLVASLCHRYGIPARLLDVAGVVACHRDGPGGITGHSEVSRALGGTHWDPGPAYPWAAWLDLVHGELSRQAADLA